MKRWSNAFRLHILLAFSILIFMSALNSCSKKPVGRGSVRYMALGDSYTIGEGIASSQAFPNQLVEKLKLQGYRIELIANPSRTGFTTSDLIERELPLFEGEKPDFGTLLIGVNDWVQGVEEEEFRVNLKKILDRLVAVLPPNRLIVVTIPDFSATPQGLRYGSGRDISVGISSFNEIVREESLKKNISVVDIFPISKHAKEDASLIASDGLHPSGKAYGQWVELMLPVAEGLIGYH